LRHVGFFDDFLKSEVNLNQSRLDRLSGHVEAIRKFLRENLNDYEKIEPQGSYALRTIIKPVRDGQEYDADILVYMSIDDEKDPKDYINELYNCLAASSTYEDKVHRRTRCVWLDYAGDFHLDMVPCLVKADGSQWICNRKENELEQSDGTGYRDWFNDKSGFTDGNLKRVTRLLKHLRDHKRTFAVKSILLTTLIGQTVYGESDGDNFNSVPDALKTVSNRLDDFLQRNAFMPTIENPVLSGESFTRHWSEENYSNFRNKFHTYRGKIDDAYDTVEHDESVDLWREIFGDAFGVKRGQSSEKSSVNSVSRTSSVTVPPRRPWSI
jgi:hypothetical protein